MYYQFRGIGLLVLPVLLSSTVQPSIVIFVVIYGLDWVATVPPTAPICRRVFGADGSVVFGWVFAAHQLGLPRPPCWQDTSGKDAKPASGGAEDGQPADEAAGVKDTGASEAARA